MCVTRKREVEVIQTTQFSANRGIQASRNERVATISCNRVFYIRVVLNTIIPGLSGIQRSFLGFAGISHGLLCASAIINYFSFPFKEMRSVTVF